jgi:hypothetical protein
VIAKRKGVVSQKRNRLSARSSGVDSIHIEEAREQSNAVNRQVLDPHPGQH